MSQWNANTVNEIAVGDILKYDVGYTRSLPHFVKVLGFTKSGKSAYVRELRTHFDDSDGYGQYGYKTPINEFSSAQKTVRLTSQGVRVDGHYAWKWDGKPALYDTLD